MRIRRNQASEGPPSPALRRGQSEGSFSLIETVIALAIIAFLIVEVAAVQGNSIVFSDYGRNVTQATWLAKRVMSQVEYHWLSKPFKELETNQLDVKFDDFPEYAYSIEIKEWKFPLAQLLQGAMGGGGGGEGEAGAASGDEEKKPEGDGMGGMLDTVLKQVFGDEPPMMTAHVEVTWAEGAQKNSTGLTYLLTNQAKLDEAILQLKPTYDKLTKPAAKPGPATPKPPAPPGAPGDQPVVPPVPPVDPDNPPIENTN